MRHLLFRDGSNFHPKRKEVSGVQQEVGVQIAAQNKQIQGYMVPKQLKNSHVCVCEFRLM